MKINRFELENFKGFENASFEFEEGMNLLIGNNGAGKSSVCLGLRDVLGNLFSDARKINEYDISEEEVRTLLVKVGDVTWNQERCFPSCVKCRIDWDGNALETSTVFESLYGGTKHHSSGVSGYMADLLNVSDSRLPLVRYFSGYRDYSMSDHAGTLPNGAVERVQGYDHSLGGAYRNDEIEKWCLRMEYESFQKKKSVSEYESFKNIVTEFVDMIEGVDSDNYIGYSGEAGQLVYGNAESMIPFDLLASGYQNVLSMIMDLAYRTVTLNPAKDFDYHSTEGIVVIDEIELHLHPRWQWNILNAFQSVFPEVQFIITTHSPIIVASAKDTNLLLLRDCNTVEKLGSAYGYEVNDVLSLRFGSQDQPTEVKDLMDQAESALDQNDMEKLKDLLRKAENTYGVESSIAKELKSFIAVNTWLEEE